MQVFQLEIFLQILEGNDPLGSSGQTYVPKRSVDRTV